MKLSPNDSFSLVRRNARVVTATVLLSAFLNLTVSAQEAFRIPSHLQPDSASTSTSQPLTDSTSAGTGPLTDIAAGGGMAIAYVDAGPSQAVGPVVQINPLTDVNLHTAGEAGGPEISAEPRRFQYGLRLAVRGVYDDNINIQHDNRMSDYYVVVEPTITLGFGDIVGHQENFIRLDYMPSIFIFTDHSENNAIQQLVRLQAQYRFSRLTLGFSEDIAILDGTDLNNLGNINNPGSNANLDVGGRTRLNSFGTHLTANYDLTGKTFLSASIDSQVNDYPNLISSHSVSGSFYINYAYSPKLVIGVGGTAGYNFVEDPNPDETFEQANARLSYQLTGKITLNASGGVEFRQFEDQTFVAGNGTTVTSRGQYVSPVFDLGLSYQPFDGTSISLSAGRHTQSSAVLFGQDFATTSVSIGIRQRLFQRMYLGLSAGYENSDYFSTIDGVPATRKDNYYYIQPSVDLTITRFWTVGAYYLRRQDNSSFQFFDFYDNQVGVRTALTF